MTSRRVLQAVVAIAALVAVGAATFVLLGGFDDESVYVLGPPSAQERWTDSDLARLRADCSNLGAADVEAIVGVKGSSTVDRYCTCLVNEAQKDSPNFDVWLEQRGDALVTISVLEPCAVAAQDFDRIEIRDSSSN
jgi:hypothetical protein